MKSYIVKLYRNGGYQKIFIDCFKHVRGRDQFSNFRLDNFMQHVFITICNANSQKLFSVS